MEFGFGRAGLEEISAAEAISLAAGSARLIDVREPWEFDAGHAPQAVNLPMSQLAERMSELDADDTLLIICHTGQRSLSVTGRLDHAGFSAINVAGGVVEWVAAGGEIVDATDGGPAHRVPHV